MLALRITIVIGQMGDVRCGRGSGWRRGPVGAGGWHGGNASFCGTVRVVWKQHSGAARASAVDEPDAEGSTEPPRGGRAPLPARPPRCPRTPRGRAARSLMRHTAIETDAATPLPARDTSRHVNFSVDLYVDTKDSLPILSTLIRLAL